MRRPVIAALSTILALTSCDDERRAAEAALQSGDGILAQRAIWTIASRHATAAWAVPALRRALTNDKLRVHAAWALAEIGPAAAAARPELLGLLRNPSGSVRAASAWAIGRLGLRDAEVRAALSKLENDDDLLAHKAAATVLARMN